MILFLFYFNSEYRMMFFPLYFFPLPFDQICFKKKRIASNRTIYKRVMVGRHFLMRESPKEDLAAVPPYLSGVFVLTSLYDISAMTSKLKGSLQAMRERLLRTQSANSRMCFAS